MKCGNLLGLISFFPGLYQKYIVVLKPHSLFQNVCFVNLLVHEKLEIHELGQMNLS